MNIKFNLPGCRWDTQVPPTTHDNNVVKKPPIKRIIVFLSHNHPLITGKGIRDYLIITKKYYAFYLRHQ